MDDQECRLCQSKDVPLIDIFSTSGTQHKLNEKISQHLQVFISSSDYLSKSICYKCFGKLDIFNKFVRDVHESQANLQKETANKLKNTGTKRMKRETPQGTIEFVEDVTSSNFEFGVPQNDNINKGDNRVSVIRYQYIDSANENSINNQTRLLTNSPNSKEIVYNYQRVNGQVNVSQVDELNSCENGIYNEEFDDHNYFIERKDSKSSILKTRSPILRKEGLVKRLEPPLNSDSIQLSRKRRKSDFDTDSRILRGNPKFYSLRRSTPIESTSNCTSVSFDATDRESKQRRKSVQLQKTEKVDFCAQIGNTLHSDLVALKNSLLLRRVCVKSSKVLTIPVPVLPNVGNKKTFVDTATSKGCQTEILLGAKSETKNSTTVVYQKVSFEGRPFLQIGSESNAVIISALPAS